MIKWISLIFCMADHRIIQDWIGTIRPSVLQLWRWRESISAKSFGCGTMVFIFWPHVECRSGRCWGLPRSLFCRLAPHFQRSCRAFLTGDDGDPRVAFPFFLNEMSRLNQAQPSSNSAAVLCRSHHLSANEVSFVIHSENYQTWKWKIITFLRWLFGNCNHEMVGIVQMQFTPTLASFRGVSKKWHSLIHFWTDSLFTARCL